MAMLEFVSETGSVSIVVAIVDDSILFDSVMFCFYGSQCLSMMNMNSNWGCCCHAWFLPFWWLASRVIGSKRLRFGVFDRVLGRVSRYSTSTSNDEKELVF